MAGSVLVIAAHPDDEVLGCGGTISRLTSEGKEVNVLIVSDGESSREECAESLDPALLNERIESARNACKIMGCNSVEFLNYPDNRLDGTERLDIIKDLEVSILEYQAGTIFTHHDGDVNIDHRIVNDCVITACRPQPDCLVNEILFFEVPSSTEWRPPGSLNYFCPNVFYDISKTIEVKKKALLAYDSELRDYPHPRSLKAVEALSCWRGASAGFKNAEAFIMGRKLI